MQVVSGIADAAGNVVAVSDATRNRSRVNARVVGESIRIETRNTGGALGLIGNAVGNVLGGASALISRVETGSTSLTNVLLRNVSDAVGQILEEALAIVEVILSGAGKTVESRCIVKETVAIVSDTESVLGNEAGTAGKAVVGVGFIVQAVRNELVLTPVVGKVIAIVANDTNAVDIGHAIYIGRASLTCVE